MRSRLQSPERTDGCSLQHGGSRCGVGSALDELRLRWKGWESRPDSAQLLQRSETNQDACLACSWVPETACQLQNILRYIPVVGRNVGGDLAKIGRDFAMPTLHDESTRVELGKMAKDRAVVPSGSVSLQELTKIVLEKHLDKSFQVSNWNDKNLNAG